MLIRQGIIIVGIIGFLFVDGEERMNEGVIGITAIGTIVVGVEIVEGGRIGPMGEMLLLNLILGGI